MTSLIFNLTFFCLDHHSLHMFMDVIFTSFCTEMCGFCNKNTEWEIYLLVHPGASGLTFLVDSADLVGESGLLQGALLCWEEARMWPTTIAQEESAVAGADRRMSISTSGSGLSTSAVTSVSGNLRHHGENEEHSAFPLVHAFLDRKEHSTKIYIVPIHWI